jgi:DNA ligase (NAD+)
MDLSKTLKKYIKAGKISNDDIYKFLDDNIDDIISNVNDIKLYEIIINAANDKYHNSVSVINDYTFDELMSKLMILDPNNKIFKRVGYTVDSIDKVKLPYHMGSMNKLKLENADAFARYKVQFKGPFLISDKLDGISALFIVSKDDSMHLYTRGDGTVGSNITHLIQYLNIKNIDKIKQWLKTNKLDRIVLRGEIIIRKETFNTKYADIAANPRNFVSGQVNAKKVDGNILKDLDLVFYEIVEPWKSIDNQYNIMTELQLLVSPFEIKTFDNLTLPNLSSILKNRKSISIYEIDGIIISDINDHPRNKDGNPDYSFAYKENVEMMDAKVEEVEWNVSKDGYLKPRIRISPIKLGGVQITYATAHNAKYVLDNKIGPNAIIKITRSGDVIPYIVSVKSPALEAQMPSEDDFGEWTWNKSGIDIILDSDEMGDVQLVKTLSYFVKKLDIKNVDESTFKTIVENGLIKELADVFKLNKSQLLELDGFQEKKATKIINELQDGFQRMTLADLMIASNLFGHGFGEKKIRKILSVYPDIILLAKKKSTENLHDMIVEISGFDDITASQFVERVSDFNDFFDNKVPKNIHDRLLLDTNKPKKENNTNKPLTGLKFVMTGFRNKNWEKIITDNGGEITSTVSKNTSVLICESYDDSSSKLVKARQYNVIIKNKNDFIKYMRDTYDVIFDEMFID